MEHNKKPFFENPRYLEKKHKRELETRTKTWGTVKFKPQAYRSNKPAFTPPDPQATAKPWQHVKNDIIDDSEELSHASRLDVDSEDARQFMQQREQNHRRNIIETSRSEPTKWETFDDEQPSTSNKLKKREKEKSKFWQCDKSKGELPTDAKNFTFRERNFFRRKITMGLAVGGVSLESAIQDLKKNHRQLQLQPVATNRFNTKDSNPAEKVKSNPFPKSSKPFQDRKAFQKGSKPFQKGSKPFQKGGKPFQKGGKGKKSQEE